MTRFTIAAVVVCAVFQAQLSFAAPMAPMATMTIEGTIQKISWHPDRAIKGIPRMSGSAGRDRTISAHYRITLTNTTVAAKQGGHVPFQSGKTIHITIDHPKDDEFLKQDMKVRIIDFRMSGDEGGIHTRFKKIEILNGKEAEQPDSTGQKTKREVVSKERAADARLGGMQLLPGYAHRPLQGFDSIVGEIVKDGGLRILYEIGHISKPGKPMIGGGFRDRPKLLPKENVRWYREQTINGQPVHVAFSKDNTLLVSFPKKGMNFRSAILSYEQLADAMLMIATYPQSTVVQASLH